MFIKSTVAKIIYLVFKFSFTKKAKLEEKEKLNNFIKVLKRRYNETVEV
jgi:hypothetical protein